MPFQDVIIDKNTPIPMYYQLKTIILDGIKSGKLKPGDMIPTEAEFGKMFNISRTTIRQTLTELVMEGYLHRVKSKGTFVAQPKVRQDFVNRVRASLESVLEQNMVPATKIMELSRQEALPEVAAALKVREGSPVAFMVRLRFVDGNPILYEECYLPLPLCEKILDMDMEKCGLYQFLDMNDKTRAVRAVRSLMAVAAGKYEAGLLEMKTGAPVQLTKCTSFTKEGLPVEYHVTKYRGDRNEFVVELNTL